MPLPPTSRLLLLAHVPLDTVAVPTLRALEPRLLAVLLTRPPVTLSVPVPEKPSVSWALLAHVPPDTVAVPLLPAAEPSRPEVLLT